MAFTVEQNKFIIISYYRNGVKRDIQRSSLQRRIFSQLPGPKCFRKVPRSYIHGIVNHFVPTGSLETGKSSGRPKVIEDVVENIRDDLF
jgi:hypothetical protein